MQKSADAFRTISEVADDLSLPQHVLRFWETRFPQIRPLKRAGGRRYYRPADVLLLKTIRQLLYDDGYTIKGVQRLIKQQGARGLGAAPPTALPGLPEAMDADPPELEEIGPAAEEVGPVALASVGQAVAGAATPPSHHAALAEVLAEVDECRRLLAGLRRH